MQLIFGTSEQNVCTSEEHSDDMDHIMSLCAVSPITRSASGAFGCRKTRLIDDPAQLVASDCSSAPLTVVLDLDETLVYAREGHVCLRAGARELLSRLHVLGCEILVWTAGERGHALNILRVLDPDCLVSQCIYRGNSWVKDPRDYFKDLQLLNRDMRRVLLLDNTPECIRNNTENSIVCEDYRNGLHCPPPAIDFTLHTTGDLLADLVRSKQSVPDYLAECTHLTTRCHLSAVAGELVIFKLGADVRVNSDSMDFSNSRCRSASTASTMDGG